MKKVRIFVQIIEKTWIFLIKYEFFNLDFLEKGIRIFLVKYGFFYLFGSLIESISLSTPEVKLGSPQNWLFLNYYSALEWESSF